MHNLTRTFLLRVVMIPIAYGEPAHAQENACAPGVSLNSKVIVLVLTTDDRDEWVFDAIHSGASGYLLKDSPRTTLIQVVKDAAVGRTPVGPNVAGKLFAHVSQHTVHSNTTITNDLSTRETEILKLLARGFPNTDIAQQLYLSEGTVRNYVSAIFTKLEVADRTQAAVKALRYGLVNLHDLQEYVFTDPDESVLVLICRVGNQVSEIQALVSLSELIDRGTREIETQFQVADDSQGENPLLSPLNKSVN